MWFVEHPMAATPAAAIFIAALACGTFFLLGRTLPGRQAGALVVSAIVTIGAAIVLSAGLNHVWEATRDREARVSSARLRHLERLQHLLREESDALTSIAGALRDGRYFALVANDARKAVWQDQTLTVDVERHFPEYYREREHLIAAIVNHDGELARARRIASSTLTLTPAMEAYRSDLVRLVVRKCGGTAVRPDEILGAPSAVRAYDEYRCDPEVSRVCRMAFDRADDLAGEAVLVSTAARRYAEETVLHGSCTYAPEE